MVVRLQKIDFLAFYNDLINNFTICFKQEGNTVHTFAEQKKKKKKKKTPTKTQFNLWWLL